MRKKQMCNMEWRHHSGQLTHKEVEQSLVCHSSSTMMTWMMKMMRMMKMTRKSDSGSFFPSNLIMKAWGQL